MGAPLLVTRRALALGAAGAVGAALLRASRSHVTPALFVLEAPHRVTPSRASMSPALVRALDGAARAAAPTSLDDALDVALDFVRARLHFGLGHATSFVFDDAPRVAHCTEHAHLFVRVLERVATRRGLALRAFAVNSRARPRGLSFRLPGRGLDEHDWVWVAGGDDVRYVDPTAYGLGAGWDVRTSVVGAVAVPQSQGAAAAGQSPSLRAAAPGASSRAHSAR